MASYVILARADQTAQKLFAGDADGLVTVRDGFSLFALILPFFYAVVHRLWLVASLMLGLIGLSAWLIHQGWVSPDLLSLVGLGLTLLFALECSSLRVAKLTGKGFKVVDLVEASSSDEALLRALDHRHRAEMAG